MEEKLPSYGGQAVIEGVMMRGSQSMAIAMGASFIVVTNVLPYTDELAQEILYWPPVCPLPMILPNWVIR